MIIKCQRCGKEFKTSPCFIKLGKKFCSIKCRYDIPKAFIICKICGKEKEVKPYLQKTQTHCSYTCKYKDREVQERINKKASQTRKARFKLGLYPPVWNKGMSYRISPKTEFKTGSVPWNKNKKGIHLSKKSEFKKGLIPLNKLPVGSIVTRSDHRSRHGNRKRAWRKIGEPNKWIQNYRYIWEYFYGKIPRGSIIHHADRNPLNDDINNLICMTRGEHINEHRYETK